MTTIHLGYSEDNPKPPVSSRAPRAALPRAVDSDEPLSIDELINASLELCANLPRSCETYVKQLRELHSRLAHGRIQLAVLGQYNRGKSTFINALTGLHVLPTSILPVTAVPTVISYGPGVTCTVHFFNGKPDLIIRESLERISATLLHYVAEQNNPKNHLCVSHVDVTTPAELLVNGTVLIDTPGFGSTYVHNTKTTLDLLAECDAALFLLGADPPTQTEQEFLKQIVLKIPRIFFILNKTDQLSAIELGAVDAFVRTMLATELKPGLRGDPVILHISAAQAMKARGRTGEDLEWTRSGMDTVRREVLDFLVRDKYFALSEALSGKLRASLESILAELAREVHEATNPIEMIEKEQAEVAANIGKVQLEADRAREALGKMKKELLAIVTQQFELESAEIGRQTTEAFDALLAVSDPTTEVWHGALALTPGILNNVLGNRASTVREQVVRQFTRARTDLFTGLESVASAFGFAFTSKSSEQTELDPPWKPSVTKTDDAPMFSWSEQLRGKKRKTELLRDRLLPQFTAIVDLNRMDAASSLTQTINHLSASLTGDIERIAAELTKYLQSHIDKKEQMMRDLQSRNGATIGRHVELIKQLSTVKTRIA